MPGNSAVRASAGSDGCLSTAYLDLARSWSLWRQPLEEAMCSAGRSICEALAVDRVGIWSYSDDRRSITLWQLHQRDSDSVAQGLELCQQQFPVYFQLIDQARLIDVSDLESDPRTLELRDSYSRPNRLRALLDAPLRRGGQLWGVLCAEHVGTPRAWSESEKWYVTSVADLLSQLLDFNEIRSSEQHLRFICDHLPLGIVRTDLAGDIRFTNALWQRLSGVPDSSDTMAWLGTFAPEDRERIAADLQAVLGGLPQGTDDPGSETTLARGENRQIAYRWVTERDSEGTPCGALGTFVDITAEKRSLRQLRENERRYRALFENAGDAIMLMRDGRIIDCNRACEVMFGGSREQLLRCPPLFLSPSLQPDGALSVAKIESLRDATECRENLHFEWLSQRLDGSTFETEITLNRMELEDGAYLFATLRDISARRHNERELARSYERVTWINQLSQRLHRESDLKGIARIAMEMLNARVPAARLLRFFDRDGDWLCQRDELGPLAGKSAPGIWDLRRPPGLMPRAVSIERVDLSAESWAPEALRKKARAVGVNHYLLLWLVDKDMLHGCLTLELANAADTDCVADEDLLAFCSTLTMAMANAHHLRGIQFRAEHDTLSGLPNRSVLHRELTAAMAGQAPLVLMLLDLDRFKEVNDALGHHVGDQLLCQIGPRLQEVLGGQPYLLCRLGGDEFAVLLRRSRCTDGMACARQLVHGLSRSFTVEGMTLQIGVSVGVACFPEHGADSHSLLRAADVAMYSAKRSGGGVSLYDPTLDVNTPERLALIADLGSAILSGGLQLHYQPQISLCDNRVVGMEALVRWQHPRFGLLEPATFMPFAEVSDAIHPLTLEVLKQSLLQQKRWRDAGLTTTVAVNLSARNLAQTGFFDQLRGLVRDTGADPALLELEITETTLMHDPRGAARLLRRIADFGAHLAIDDFGTGYSSLAYLRSLPIHALKIDRAFVGELARNDQDAVIVRSIITLAHNLNLRVVAEGVEDGAAVTRLCDMGCDLAQGFYYSRPQPASVIDHWRQALG